MKNKLLFIIAWMFILAARTQGNVMLHSGGTTKMYFGNNAYDNAYLAAKYGDTLYLSGGEYSVNYAIATKLTIIGAGYHPDSTKVTRSTILSGSITFKNGSSGSWLEGLNIVGNVTIGFYDTSHNIRMHRCYLGGYIQTDQRGGLINNNFTITECNFSSFNGGNTINNLYLGNSIIRSSIAYINHPSLIENNYFVTDYYNNLFTDIQWATVRNNIINNSFYSGIVLAAVYNIKFRNNLWTNAPGGTYLNNDTLADKIGIIADSIFIYAPGFTYKWNYNYHLKTKTATKYRGVDGTEIGLYGGSLSPFKEGAVPGNPHIQSAAIEEKTDANGKLKINIKVQAQKR